MKCRVCGAELPASGGKCAFCGTDVTVTERQLVYAEEPAAKHGEEIRPSLAVRMSPLMDDDTLLKTAICKMNGVAMAKDVEGAEKLLTELAYRGNADGMYRLAELLLGSDPPKTDKAVEWLRAASLNGHIPSRTRLKMMFNETSVTEVKPQPIEIPQYDDKLDKKVRAVLPCVVIVTATKRTKSRHYVGSTGAGCIIQGGYVVTNAHVLGDLTEGNITKIVAEFEPSIDKDAYDLELVSLASDYDVAVLRFKGAMDKMITNRDNLRLWAIPPNYGDEVYTIGNPLGLGLSVSKGVVSCPQREGMDYRKVEDVIQTDISSNHGNSGGAVFDMANNVIGLMTFRPGRSDGGIGMAVPAKYIVKTLNDIIK